MKYAAGIYLEHKSLVSFMFMITSFNEEKKTYTGDLYQGSDMPIESTLPSEVVEAYYQPAQHKYKVGDCFILNGNTSNETKVEIIKMLPSRRYEVVCFIGDTPCGVEIIGDFWIDRFDYKHVNPAPPEPVGCKHELVDIGVRHTRMVCKHCEYEENIH